MHHYLIAMRKYAVFRGRASRAEYWWFTLVYGLLLVAAALLDTALGTLTRSSGLFIGLVQLVHFMPGLATFIRRLHDRDRSGYWFCLSFTVVGVVIPIIFSLQRGTVGSNRFGEDPYAPVAANHVEPVVADLRSEFYAPTPASIRRCLLSAHPIYGVGRMNTPAIPSLKSNGWPTCARRATSRTRSSKF